MNRTELPVGLCPWCQSSDGLKLLSDGVGSILVCCALCGCKGPPVPIEDDFDETDVNALLRWSSRHPTAALDPALLEEVRIAVRLHAILGAQLGESASVAVPYPVLHRILEAAA